MPIPGNSHSAGKKPTPPTIGTATAGAASASVAFTASDYIGKGTITYTATSNPGGVTGTSSSSPITVSGLTNGTTYTFSAVGTSNYGVVSNASDSSNPVTPVAPPPFFPPFFPFFPFFPDFPTCTAGCGPYSYTYGNWSAYSTCVGGTQSRSRTVTATRTCTATNCSQTTETTSYTETETQACTVDPPPVGGTTYYGCCSNGLLVSGQYSSSGVAVTNLQAACAADEPGNNLSGGVYTTPQNCT